MLNIINNLSPFFEDCYIEVGVREYSRLMGVSPPTASNLLKKFEKENLLKKRGERGYLLFRANRESFVLKDLSRIYWKEKLKRIIEYLNDNLHYPYIILFGSLSKLETKKDSDIDLAVFGKISKKVNFEKFEKEIKRNIQSFKFDSIDKIKSKELKMNILNGYVLGGEII
ncbi:MAG: nucleotidyltransferase domain-containing protein [Nanoarchaeota archaeon]|nr:nucleotidyltransferase domain-containing protein [Nanoarchaeota archaeon]MBU1028087.1 nucleotidyltransferase domain-containing protein [Nanoarchaeota archaeon]